MAVAVVSQPLTQKQEPQHETAVTIHVTSTEAGRSVRIAIEWFRQVQGFDKTACAFGEKDGKGDSCENRKPWNKWKRPLNSHRLY
jgi:hypothetical protein